MELANAIGSKITVRGHIHRVTYKEPNYTMGGFAIIKFVCEEIESGEIPKEFLTASADNEEGYPTLTFTGATCSLSVRLKYEIRAELAYHKTYGYQYKILLMTESVNLNTVGDITKFLVYLYPDITVSNITKTLPDPISVLENKDVGALLNVPGIGPYRAEKILEKYQELKVGAKAYIQLYEYGLSSQLVKKLLFVYQSPEVLIQRIQENPYNLIYDVKGVGWAKADQIAFNIGITEDDPRRTKAYIYYLLIKDGQDNGNTYMELVDMLEFVQTQIPTLSSDDVRNILLELIKDGKLFYEKNTRRIGLSEYRVIEEEIAKELSRISGAQSYSSGGIDEVIEACETFTGFKYSDEQRVAIYTCLSNNITIVSGMAGCGKSSVMYPVTQTLLTNHRELAQCALSGKAALNLTEITGVEGSTIHRLLGYDVETSGFVYNKANPLPLDMVILDETSMVDESLFLSLLEAIPDGCKLILLGDTGQLEPIGLGCLFRDLINCERIQHIEFTKIFRQAQKSGIITEAAKVYNGIPILPNTRKPLPVEVRGELQDFKIVPVVGKEEIPSLVEKEYKRYMNDYAASPRDIIIVTGKRAIGETSARALNAIIQKVVNGKPFPDDITLRRKDGETIYDITFRRGDRVLVTKNCYTTLDLMGKRSPVFNGNIGDIISLSSDSMTIKFLQGTVIYPYENFCDLELGYAITCHKCQGSGIPYVITVCDYASYTLLSKEWLYTALTRAKKFNTLIAQSKAVVHACDHTSVIFKKTWLKDLLIDSFDKLKTGGNLLDS